jgi:hypothetical protein
MSDAARIARFVTADGDTDLITASDRVLARERGQLRAGIDALGARVDVFRGMLEQLEVELAGKQRLLREIEELTDRRPQLRLERRLHERLSPLLSHPSPTAAEEAADPHAADRRYREAVGALRERTRDRSRFGLLLAENIDYGFRRNCLGLRPYALIVAAGCLLVMAGRRGTAWARQRLCEQPQLRAGSPRPRRTVPTSA